MTKRIRIYPLDQRKSAFYFLINRTLYPFYYLIYCLQDVYFIFFVL